MEHLMSPEERKERDAEIKAAPSIPWLGFDHDGGSRPVTTIQKYPLGRDFPSWTQNDLERLEFEYLDDRPPETVLAMIQSWLSLGLLESAFGVHFDTQFFLSDHDAHLVNTHKLRTWIDQYYEMTISVVSADTEIRQIQRSRLVVSLEYAEFWIRRLRDMEKDQDQGQHDPHNALVASHLFGPVTRFVTLVAEAVWTVASRVMPFLSDTEELLIDCHWHINQVNDTDLRRRCVQRGWCPSVYDKTKEFLRTPTSFLEYLSVVSPLQHGTRLHLDCSTDQCVQYNVDTKTYTTRHRPDCRGCAMVKPPIADVKDTLWRGLIPVLSGSSLLDPGTGTVVETISEPELLDFVAFSHVWSDGVGSTAEAGLPTCQVKFLLDKAIRVCNTDLLWIDSLCIPADRETRKLAIANMARTYSSAAATVILDSQIQHCSYDSSLETRLLVLSMSKWQERLWTLQESSLSKNLWCLFQDDQLRHIESMVSNECSNKSYLPIIMSTGMLLNNLSDRKARQITLGGVQRNLYRRTSSKLDDEALAVAPLFPHVDMSSLLSLEGEERMAELFKQVKYVPRGIVVAGPQKLDIDGFRWAPRSFMSQKGSIALDVFDQSAIVTETGLRIRYWLCELSFAGGSRLSDGKHFYEADKDWCVRVGSTWHYPDARVFRSGDVVATTVKPVPSADMTGVLLRKISEGFFVYQPELPVFRFVGLVGVDIMSQNAPFQHAAGLWAFIIQQAEERRCVISEMPTDVYIR